MISTEAWQIEKQGSERIFQKREVTFSAPVAGESWVEPLAVGWEGNVSHAIDGKPLDVNVSRQEDSITLGNNGVVRLRQTNDPRIEAQAADCDGVFLVQPLFHPGAADKNGYLTSVFGYDMRGSSGLLARDCVLPNATLIPLPVGEDGAKFWASYTIRYMTAWSLYQRALKVHGVLNATARKLTFGGWGGGTTLALLQLAALEGHEAVMFCSSRAKCEEAEQHGITPVNVEEIRNEHAADERAAIRFLRDTLREKFDRSFTFDVFSDFVGNPTINLTMDLLRQGGILATAGWKQGPMVKVNRALSCIKQHVHVYCHHANASEIADCVTYGLDRGWHAKSTADFGFDDCARVHEQFNQGVISSYFPVVLCDR